MALSCSPSSLKPAYPFHSLKRPWILVAAGLLCMLGLLLVSGPAAAQGPVLGGAGGADAVYNPVDGYVYILNNNDTVSVVDGTRLVANISLPTGVKSRLTDLDVASNGDVYVSVWFYDLVVVLRDQQVHTIMPRQNDSLPGTNGIENGPLVVAANPVNGLVYVATSWTGEPENNGVAIISDGSLIAHVKTGSYPSAIAIHPGTGRVYVANSLSDTVTVLDGTSLTRQIPVGDYPAAVGVDALHGRVYVANRNSGTVTVINEATLSVAGTVASGTGPMALVVDDQAGRAYVVNIDSDTLAVIDGAALTRVALVGVGDNPLAVAQDPVSRRVYVANQMGDTLSVIQGTALAATIPVGRSPVAFAWDPAAGLYVVNHLDASLSLVSGEAVAATVENLPRLAFTALESLPNGHTVVADLIESQTWFLDGAEVITQVQTLDTRAPLWEPPARLTLYDPMKVPRNAVAIDDQGRVFVASLEEEAVSVIGESQGRIQTLWAHGRPGSLEAMPGTGRVYAAVPDGVTVFQGSPVTSSFLSDPRLSNAYLLAAWPERDWMVVARNLPNSPAQVVFLDDSTQTIIHTTTICQDPAALEIDRARGLVYVTCAASNSVGVMRGTTWLGEIPVGQYPQGLAVNPVNGYAYVASMLADQVSVLDGTALVATIRVPGLPISVDVDQETGLVYVACEGGNAVAVIEGTALLASIPTGEFPNGIFVHEGQNLIYASNAHAAKVDIFNFQEAPPDPGEDWMDASPILTGTAYAAPIQSQSDVDWYRVHLDQPGAAVAITVGGLPLDYDLAFFNNLTETVETTATLETLDFTQVLEDGSVQSLFGWVDMSQLRSLPRGKGGPQHLSANRLLNWEVISDKVWETGEYYIAVWGHNGAYADQPYTLRVEVTPPEEPVPPAVPVSPIFTLPPSEPEVHTLILTSPSRLENAYGSTRKGSLMTRLDWLAQATQGKVISLDSYPAVVTAYAQWDQLPENPLAAEYTADTLKALLEKLLTVTYVNTEYIVLVGGDNILPFGRVPDLTLIANERGYNAWVEGGSPTAARLRSGYLLTDSFYASYSPIFIRGHGLYIPEYAIGRLVETPEDMIAAIDAYLDSASRTPTGKALVTGYDFLIDEASGISATLGAAGFVIDALIRDGWTAEQLRPLLLLTNHDLFSINGHFNHQALVAGDNSTWVSSAEILTAAADYAGDLVFSVGCQSGLNVPDEDALGGQTSWTLDFSQVFLQRGAVYIANTGYGYGDSDAVGYSEILAENLARQLAHGPLPVGKALMLAKQAYYSSVGYGSFGEYDEKALVEWTLYGLPMVEVALPAGLSPDLPPQADYTRFGPQVAGPSAYATLPVTVSPVFTRVSSTREIGGSLTAIGDYYHVNQEIQISPGRPIQPRLSIDLRAALPAGQVVHGALFTGARYTEVQDFDPVVSRIVSDTAGTEPLFPFTHWYPFSMHVINRLDFGTGLGSERLVVTPAQYLGKTATTGTERLFTPLHFEVYYTPVNATTDFSPPVIRYVALTAAAQTVHFDVQAVDEALVQRVVAVCDDGQGEWFSVELARASGAGWSGNTTRGLVQCLVQAVDAVGNVSLIDNKGEFYAPVGVSLSEGQTTTVRPGQTRVFNHTLANPGARADTYQLAFSAFPGLSVIFPPSLLRLEAGQEATVAVTVTVPLKTQGGIAYPFDLSAESLTNPAVSARVGNIVRVPLFEVFLPRVLKTITDLLGK